jgi:type VI secretion system protein ImpI
VLKLRIENFDQLPDGGPIEFNVDRRGFDFGREQHLDWTLPDQSGVISRKHCEVRFFEQSYWLFDLSTNGTFVNKSSKRVQSPHKLADGDELRIGEYIISVSIAGAQAAAGSFLAVEAAQPVAEPKGGANIWDTGADAPPPIDPRDLMPPTPEIRRAPDFLHQVVHLPPVVESAVPSPPVKPSPDIWGAPVAPIPLPATTPEPFPSVELQFQPSAPMYVPPDPAAPTPEPPVVPRANAAASCQVMERLAKGVGLPSDFFQGRDPAEVAEMTGALLNQMCGHMIQLLSARAAAKTLSRSSSRTMIQARENNPLKFMPTPEDALRIMLGQPTPSYLTAQQAVENSFADLKSHQIASLAAMQQAASTIFAELSPEAIKKASDGGKKSLLSTGKGKYWETFVDVWNQRAGGREHGMLTAFLDAFAAHYDAETKNKP